MWTWLKKQLKPSIRDQQRILKAWPEMDLLQDPDERWTVFTTAAGTISHSTGVWLLLLAPVVAVILSIGTSFAERALQGTLWSGLLEHTRAGSPVLAMGLTLVLISRIRRRHFDRALREQLIRRGCAVCIKCGYDLRGQTVARCPECGVLFNPDILGDSNYRESTEHDVSIQKQNVCSAPEAGHLGRRIKRYPDLALFATNERDQAWKLARTGTGWCWLAALPAILLSAGMVHVATGRYLVPRLRAIGRPEAFRFMILAMFVLLATQVCMVMVGSFCRRHIERSLRRQLVQRGRLICIRCGYDVKGQVEPRCPECHAPFDPKLLEAARGSRRVPGTAG